ncbi:MAG: T9SS type A sorting domain-containing protein [Bacteroidetes bacterium]|nr:T9SS type A sorting domain-containing protein [Bacteroidota bacterium]
MNPNINTRLIISTLSAFFSILTTTYCQHPNIFIWNGGNPNEPAICISPKNPAVMMAGANLNQYYLSTDGGANWAVGALTSPYGVFGDPCVVVDTNQNFHFFHLSEPPWPSFIDRIVCQTLTGGVLPWSSGSYTYYLKGKSQDKDWAVVNPYNNELYACWTQFDSYQSNNPLDSTIILFAKSTDEGNTWTNVNRLSRQAGDCMDSDSTVEGAVPAVGPNGEIYVSWSGPSGILFDRSLDGGISWLNQDIYVCDQPGGWDFSIPGINRANGMPVTCCDLSNGPYRGNIYINFSDQRNSTEDTDIWLVKSTDSGNTWSQPKRVNDDPAGKQQFFTWMTVDQVTGYLYFVFYDRRNYANDSTDVYMAVSKDGGETFINFRISESAFMPVSSVFFGDYTNVAAHDNIVRPIWTRMDNNTTSIFTALVDVSAMGIDHPLSPFFNIDQIFPNPFRQTTTLSYTIQQPCRLSLKIVNLLGKEVVTLINNENRPAGKHTETFDATKHKLSPGVYFLQLSCGTSMDKREMVIIK